MLEGFLYLSFLHLDFLGCEDCENFDADPDSDAPICEICNMKEGCKKLLEGLQDQESKDLKEIHDYYNQ